MGIWVWVCFCFHKYGNNIHVHKMLNGIKIKRISTKQTTLFWTLAHFAMPLLCTRYHQHNYLCAILQVYEILLNGKAAKYLAQSVHTHTYLRNVLMKTLPNIGWMVWNKWIMMSTNISHYCLILAILLVLSHHFRNFRCKTPQKTRNDQTCLSHIILSEWKYYAYTRCFHGLEARGEFNLIFGPRKGPMKNNAYTSHKYCGWTDGKTRR